MGNQWLCLAPPPQQKTHKIPMELNIEGFDGQTYVVDVDVDDTVKDLRRKVATAAGFAEDSFGMRFGGNDEEDINITALSAGDTVLLTETKKQESIAALHALGETDLTPNRLERVQDPKVAQLFLQAEVVTATPRWFLAHTTLSSLDLSAPLATTAIGDCFLARCSSLKSVDLSGLSNVTHIGENFLESCMALETIDLSGLSNVTHVGKFFLSDCTSLTAIDFAGLSSVTSLGNCFLSRCKSLTSIDFAGLGRVTSLGEYFLLECTALTSIDFAGLVRVTSLEDFFLLRCTSLISIDFAGLSSVTSLGNRFLCRCTSLTSIDFAGLGRVTSLEKHFLSGCTSLTSIDFAGLSDVTRFESCFLEGCTSLKRRDFPAWNVPPFCSPFSTKKRKSQSNTEPYNATKRYPPFHLFIHCNIGSYTFVLHPIF